MSTNFLALPPYQNIARPARMTPGDVIGANVKKLRQRRDMAAAELARLVGVGIYTIQQIEKGVTQKSKYLPDIARVLGVSLKEIDPAQSKDVSRGTIALDEISSSGEVDLYATTEAGGGAMVMGSDPVGRVERPRSLAHIDGVYGVIVSGDSMGSVVRAGDVVVVNPHKHPRREDLCVFRIHENGEFRSTIKEFISQTEDSWRVKRYFPEEREFSLKKRDWPECHVVAVVHKR